MRTFRITTTLSLFFCLFFFAKFAFSYTLEWDIGNRFRTFDYLAKNDTTKSKELFENYAPNIKIDDKYITIFDWMAKKVKEKKAPLSPYGDNKRGPWTEETEHNNKSGYDKDFVYLPDKVYLTLQLKKNGENALATSICDIYLNDKKIKTADCFDKIIIENYPGSGGKLDFINEGVSIHTQEVKPTLKVILGLGDSYASGEGAPDKPTVWSKFNLKEWPLGAGNLHKINNHVQVGGSAQWYSNKCNRSYFAAQSLAALKIARDNPHAIVSFVHLACTGAEVVDGILAPQRNAPGAHTAGCSNRDLEDIKKPRPNCDVHTSQLTSVVRLLCKGKTSPISLGLKNSINNALYEVKIQKYQIDDNWINELEACSPSELIKPDLVLMQIGGNDIGFSKIIAWALLPKEGRSKIEAYVVGLARSKSEVVCPDKSSAGCINNQPTAQDRLKDLPIRYMALNFAFKNILNIDESKVVLTGYTNPMFDIDNKVCSKEGILKNEFWLTKTLIPEQTLPDVWKINLVKKEAEEIHQKVIHPLNFSVSENVSGSKKWRFADMSDVMNNNGWCVNTDGRNIEYFLNPRNIKHWDAFEDKGRFIRTVNDSVMTQWRSGEADLNRVMGQKELSAYSNDYIYGAWHPNVQGHAAIADKLYESSKDLVAE